MYVACEIIDLPEKSLFRTYSFACMGQKSGERSEENEFYSSFCSIKWTNSAIADSLG